MARRKAYSVESLKRGLQHHIEGGAVRSFTHPGQLEGTSKWMVDLPGLSIVELTEAQVYGLLLGLAAGERTYKPLDLGLAGS